MAVTRELSIPNVDENGSSGTTVATDPFALTAGRTVVIGVRHEGGTSSDTEVPTLTDTAGNTYTHLGGITYPSTSDTRINLFICEDCAGNAANVITATYANARAYRRLCGAVYAAPAGFKVVADGAAQFNSGTDANHSAGPVSVSADGALVAVLGTYNSLTISAQSGGLSALVNGGSSAGSASNYHAFLDGFPGAGSFTPSATGAASQTFVMAALALTLEALGGPSVPKFLGPAGQRLRTHDYKGILIV